MKQDDAHLIEGCLRKDQRAYSAFYERYAPKMYGVCLRYTRSSAAAEDVLHDGFIKVFENLHRLRDINAVEPWMRRIMVYTAVNAQRKELPLAASGDVDTNVTDDYCNGNEIIAKVDADMVVKVMQQLPASFRTVLNLCEIEGYDFAEVARIMKTKENTVRSALTRAKQMLVKLLKEN